MPPSQDPAPADSPLGTSVSQTFLAFLEPIWDEVSHDPRARDGLLQVGMLTWNAAVYADRHGDRSWLDQIDSRVPAARGRSTTPSSPASAAISHATRGWWATVSYSSGMEKRG